jgi:cathepsin X
MHIIQMLSLLFLPTSYARINEFKPLLNHNDYKITHSEDIELPNSWDWGNISNVNFLTKNLNQHIPQYCGSCWAHGAVSALGDRIKISRKANGPDINLAVQYLLNCGNAGTCNGGDHLAAYKYIHETGGIPYDTCLAYEACSSDSSEQACQNRNFECSNENICRTCNTFTSNGGKCTAITKYPNASIQSFGMVSGVYDMMSEIYKNGPIACGINANKILEYTGGIMNVPHELKLIDHIISIVGWGYDEKLDKQYWIIRNSWGEYWGERGFMRLVAGENQLGTEKSCAWAIPSTWTDINYPCFEDGSNC